MSKGYILGIACGYHDPAAALIKNGKVFGMTGFKNVSAEEYVYLLKKMPE